MKVTFRMVSRSLFSTRIDDEDVDMISRTICTIQEFMVRQIVQPYLDPWFAASGELRKHEKMREDGDRVVRDYIKKRRREGRDYHDLLQILMDARYADGDGMPDELLLSESMQLLVAGHETSSNALSWLMYLLSRHPEYVERIREEFASVLNGAPLGFADVARMEFTTQVIEESLRLYPPFWMVDREAIENDRVGDLEIPGHGRDCLYLRGAPLTRLLGESRAVPSRAFQQRKQEEPQSVYSFAFWRRAQGLHRRKLRDVTDAHDSQRPPREIRLHARSRSSHRSAAHDHPAAKKRDQNDVLKTGELASYGIHSGSRRRLGR